MTTIDVQISIEADTAREAASALSQLAEGLRAISARTAERVAKEEESDALDYINQLISRARS